MEPSRTGACLLGVRCGIATLAFLLSAVACTGSVSEGSEHGAQTTAHPTPIVSEAPPPESGSKSIGSRVYGSHISVASGLPGDNVQVYGTTFRGEDGKFSPSKHLEVWWNTEIPDIRGADARPINPDSPVLLLTTEQDMDGCRFLTRFEVPNVPRGGYRIRTIIYWFGGYGWFGYDHFTVK